MTDEPAELAEIRDEIDRLDDRIADLVAERVATAETVAEIKAGAGRDLVDERREDTVKTGYETRFEERGLAAEDGSALAEFLIEMALEQERDVAEGV